jgi:4-amino-4-deoxy-L-arabinose transferase-like glycosyltransferase
VKNGGIGNVHTAIVFGLVLAAAAAMAAGLGLTGLSGFVLGVAVLASAEVVGLSVILSVVHWLTAGAMTAATVVVVMVSWWWWRRAGAPRPARPHGSPRRWCRAHPAVAVILAAAGAALAFQLWMGLRIPPNEIDSLYYHLPRAVAWVHRHSALQFRPGYGYWPAQQVAIPVNGDLFVAWTMALSHGDRLANAVQWCFALALGATVAAGARVAGFSRSAALLAAGVVLLLPEVLLQSATTQVDLILSFFVAATALFAVRALRQGSAADAALAAIAFGLAVGTKESALFAAPGLALIVVASWRRNRPPARVLLAGAGIGVIAVALLGSFNYVQNLERTGKVTGGHEAAVHGDFIRAGFVRDLGRVSWALVEIPGLPERSSIDRVVHPVASWFVGTVHGSYFGTPPPVRGAVDDGASGYGLVGVLVVVPVAAVALVRGPAPQRVLVVGGLAYFLLVVAFVGYSPDVPRQLLPAVALVSPLLARVERHPWARRVVVVVAVSAVVPVLTLNQSKPLLLAGRPSILRADRIQAQLSFDRQDRRHVAAAEALNRRIPARGKVGVLNTQEDLPYYVLYDPGLRRDVVPLGPSDLDPLRLRRRGIIGVFFWPTPSPAECAPSDCQPVLPPAGAVPLPEGAAFLPSASAR